MVRARIHRRRTPGVISLFATALLENRAPTIYGDGEQSRDFTYVANVVDGVLRACEAPAANGRIINVATGKSISLNALFEEMRRLIGANVKPLYTEQRTGDVRDSLADLGLAREVLGYEPIVPFEEGIRRTVEWYRGMTAHLDRRAADIAPYLRLLPDPGTAAGTVTFPR